MPILHSRQMALGEGGLRCCAAAIGFVLLYPTSLYNYQLHFCSIPLFDVTLGGVVSPGLMIERTKVETILPNKIHGSREIELWRRPSSLRRTDPTQKKSTGPRSEGEKARSRLNSRKHGLTAKTLIIVGECAGF
jgi:hypothetical protein